MNKEGWNQEDFLTKVYIHKESILHNLKTYQKTYKGVDIAPVLKSNAYGHGLKEIAQIVESQNIPFIVLNTYGEAATLRDERVTAKILIVGYVLPEHIKRNALKNTSFTITSVEQLQAIQDTTTNTNIHLKIDTGMHRQGITYEQLNESIDIIQANAMLNLEGVCSHLADADNSDQTFTIEQCELWEKIVTTLRKKHKTIQHYHIAATAGMPNTKKAFANTARLGIGLYGIDSAPESNIHLKPAMEVKSIITTLKTVPAGGCVGYNCTYRTKEATTIATVPAGYFEGVDRRVSNKGFFTVKGANCPIVGRVSMNITTIAMPTTPTIHIGDEVTIISNNANDNNTITNIAQMTGTIPWEIFVHIPEHLPRIVV